MIVVVPCVVTGVTTPVLLFIVATDVLLLPQVPPAVASVNAIVEPLVHSCALPVTAPGVRFTVAVVVAADPQPSA